jgi:hypothetical protein
MQIVYRSDTTMKPIFQLARGADELVARAPGIRLTRDITQTNAIPRRGRKRHRRLKPGKARFLSARCGGARLRTSEGVPGGEFGDEGSEEVHEWRVPV